MNEDVLLGLGAVIVLGILAQWLAWRINLPSILILLLCGLLIGPISGFLQPDALFGDLLFPLVSISVAVILYEGGLTLKLQEMRTVGKTVRNLVSIGAAVTWTLSAVAAWYFLELNWKLAILLGAILVVTGPTVIVPVLRFVRPKGQLNSVLKWEGILNDPIGAILAVLVFEGILAGGLTAASTQAISGLLKTIFIAGGIGVLAGYLMALLLKHHLLPDFLQNAGSLSLVVLVFVIANLFQPESGLFGVTVMGIYLANQNKADVGHIIEFKENLRVLLISVLFIILAARLRLSDLEVLGWPSLGFLALLILVIRPAAVLLSTIGAALSWRERIFLSWMAPRGIVAAAVVSIFSLKLTQTGNTQATQLVPLMFLVIIGTIAVYGISAMPLARWLRIADADPQGALLIGANRVSREIGAALQREGFRVLLVDTNWAHISAARMEDLETYYGSILSEHVPHEIDLSGIGRLLALTPNHEVNALAALYFSKMFGRAQVYQLGITEQHESASETVTPELRGNSLFGKGITYERLEEKFRRGAVIKSTAITDAFDFADFQQHYQDMTMIPLFLIDETRRLQVFSAGREIKPEVGQTLVSLVKDDG